MAKYEAKFYDEDSDCRLCVGDITLVKYRDNLVEFTTKPPTTPAEIVVMNMDKWAWFAMTEMED